jgi:hypothetical protein
VTEPQGRAPVPSEYRDRTALLKLFGALLLVFGLGCLFMGGMTTLALLLGGAGQPGAPAPADARMVLPGLLFYLFLAVCYVALGVGSLNVRRWARPLVLIFSWLWLFSGVVSLATVSLVLPKLMESMRPPGADAQVMSFAMGCTFIFLAVLYVILPGLLITVYGSRDVAATFAARDPVPRWTDRCPTPVLGLCLVLAYTALCWLFAPLLPLGPMLGVSAPAVMALGAALAALLAALAWATFRLRPWAWWGLLAVWTLGASASLAFFRDGIDLKAMYRQMEIPEAQIAQMEKSGLFKALQGPELMIAVGVCAFAGLAYLFWVRKHFLPPPPPPRPDIPGSRDEMP